MLKLSSLFSDHAVLQRSKPIPVWGWTEGNSRLTFELNGIKLYGNSSAFGNFIVRFPAMAAGGPYTLTVKNEATGETVTANDILVGEVWICSGQSNMQYPLNADWGEPFTLTREARAAGEKPLAEKQADDFTAEVAEVAEQFRFFHVPLACTQTEELTTDAVWQKMSEPGFLDCAAVGAWFGLKLCRDLKVPVGLLFSAYGGTKVYAWTSRGALALNPYTANLAEEADQTFLKERVANLPPIHQDYNPAADAPSPDPGNSGFGWGWASVDFDDTDWKPMEVPGSWIKQNIAGHGAVWIRFELELNDSWQNLDRDLLLSLGGIDKTDITYFNGVEVGRTGKGLDDLVWNLPRMYFIPGNLVKPGKNVIAIRMYSFLCDGSLNGSRNLFYLQNPVTKEKISLGGFHMAKAECDFGGVPKNGFEHPMFVWGRGNPNTPGILFDTMIRPLVPYGVRGAIWYQGESDANYQEECYGYASSLENLVDDWRRAFCVPDMAFIQVELAGFKLKNTYSDTDAWPILRDEQQKACREMKGIYMATAIDKGEVDDIHPQEKRIPGERLAACALNKVYGRLDVVPHGPILQRYELQGNTARLYFSEADGMEFRGDPRRCFFVAGSSRIATRNHDFKPADDVQIEGNCIIVRSNTFPWIGAVRTAGPISPNWCFTMAPAILPHRSAPMTGIC